MVHQFLRRPSMFLLTQIIAIPTCGRSCLREVLESNKHDIHPDALRLEL